MAELVCFLKLAFRATFTFLSYYDITACQLVPELVEVYLTRRVQKVVYYITIFILRKTG